MFLRGIIKKNKSLSVQKCFERQTLCKVCRSGIHAKTLHCTRRKASFTVEAAFVVPLFVFAAALVMNLFPAMEAEIQVTGAMQYAAREMAVSAGGDDNTVKDLLTLAQGKLLISRYLSEHECDTTAIQGGTSGISILGSDVSDDYVTLRASYQIALPITFCNIRSFPVQQCVRTKKWTGANPEGADETDSDYVYITPTGSAYHTSPDCSYLKLSIRSVALSDLASLRSKDGSIYYPCSCYSGGSKVYITDYGTQYHSDLNCSGLKRTILKVKKDEVGGRHACSKCAK